MSFLLQYYFQGVYLKIAQKHDLYYILEIVKSEIILIYMLPYVTLFEVDFLSKIMGVVAWQKCRILLI